MWSDDRDDRPRKPALEGEIIPPEGAGSREREREQVWIHQRVFFAPPGPLSMLIGLVVLAALVTLGVVLFLGIFFLVLPVVLGAAAAFLLLGLLRNLLRR